MELIDKVYDYLAAGKFIDADKLALELYDNVEYREIASELLISIAIEASDKDLALERCEFLKKMPVTAYRLFLQARTAFMFNDRQKALNLLEKAIDKKFIANASNQVKEKIYNLLGQCYRFLGYPSKAAEAYYCAYESVDVDFLKRLEYSNYLFNLHYLNFSPQEYFHAHQQYNNLFNNLKTFKHGRAKQKEKLRIGYISPDFRNHVVLRFTYAMLTSYNKDKFEVYCYSTGKEDKYSKHLSSLVTQWHSLQGKSSEIIARQIYDDGIDILVELAGHCSGNNLPVLAYKPAPIQLCGIGYFATTGLQTVDYFLTDEYLQAKQQYFTENLLVLPHSHFCYDPLNKVPAVNETPAIRNKYITFGSFNNLTKVTDDVLVVWQKILQQLPTAKLLLKGSLFDDEFGRSIFIERLHGLGYNLDRVELRGITEEYLAEYLDVDIALDTFPYPGGGTSCDALYMGVPVISLLDGSHGGNFGGSLLKNAGLDACCTYSEDEYIKRAVEFANDVDLLNALHLGLRNMMLKSPIMNKSLYMQDLEASYNKIWQIYVDKQNNTYIASKTVSNLFREMKNLWANGDIKQTIALADTILLAKPKGSYILGALLEIYVDTNQMEQADETAKLLLAQQEHKGYDLFLLGKNSELHGKWDDAISYGKKALAANDIGGDSLAEVYNMLGTCYQALCFPEEAAESYLSASKYADKIGIKLAAYSNYLFSLHYLNKNENEMRLAAEGYQQLLNNMQTYNHKVEDYKDIIPRNKKIRIGYISSDLGAHVVSEFVQGFFMDYDKTCFEVYVYANGTPNEFSEEIKQYVTEWKYVAGLTNSEIAHVIKQDNIHILVELAGHTNNNNLSVLAFKPAPIQICGIGYFDSTGMDAVDYFLGDKFLDAAESAPNFKEKLLRIEGSHWCYSPLEKENVGLAENGCSYVGNPCKAPVAPFQKKGYITFGSFNTFPKLNVKLFKVWGKILQKVPNSKLFLKGGFAVNQVEKKRLNEMLLEAGITQEQIILEDRSEHYMQRYSEIDIALDTFPYGGGGTTCDALFMGVPLITLYGRTHHSRFGYSALQNIGDMDDCCAASVQEYIDKAVALAKNTARIKYLHQTIRRRMEMSPLMDKAKYMVELEAGYFAIWEKYLNIHLQQGDLLYARIGYDYLKRKDFYRGNWWIKKAIATGKDDIVELYCYLAGAAKERVDHYTAYKEVCNAYNQLQLEEDKGTNDFICSLLNNKERFAREIGQIDECVKDSAELIEVADSDEAKSFYYGSYLYGLLCTFSSWQKIYEAHRGYNAIFFNLRKRVKKLVDKRIKSFKQRKHNKIKIGYMSPDFHRHVMFSFYYVLFSNYNKEKFHVTAYQLTEKTDGFTENLKTMVDEWQIVHKLSKAELAEKIYTDEIDILVDLAGHTGNSGLAAFVYRAAPVQISGLGWMETTGLVETDYFITDKYVDPENTSYLTEKPLYLSSQFCYIARNDVPNPQGAPCKSVGYITFGVFNNWYKINDYILGLWKQIMDQLPDAVLLIKCQVLASLSAQEEAFNRLYNIGMDMDRVIFEPATNTYMTRYLSVDIALDTYPYPGGGTTCDTLYMGVPVVSLYSRRRGTRFGYGILENAGLGELATDDPAAYVEKAVALAKDWDLLDILHRNIRKMFVKSSVMDTKRYMAELENKYQEYYIEAIR